MLFSQLPQQYPLAELLYLAKDIEIVHLLTDTRKLVVHHGSVFFAITGSRHDAHDYLPEVLAAGIKSIVVEKELKLDLPDDINVIRTDSCIKLLQSIATHQRGQFDYPVVGITGSNGKTVVKEWLTAMLAKYYFIVKSPGSYNSQLGVALSTWQMTSRHNLGIFEAGISEVGEMANLERVIKPDIGVFTNLGSAHDQGFKNRKEKLREKLQLFSNAKSLIYCFDHESVREEIERSSLSSVGYSWSSISSKADVFYQLEEDKNWCAHTEHGQIKLRIPFTDVVSLENIFHCITTLLSLGISEEKIKLACLQVTNIDHRLILKKGIGGCYIVDDTYNNDLSGLVASLDYMEQQPHSNNKTVILSDILQSGQPLEDLYADVSECLKGKEVNRFIGIGKDIGKCAELFKSNSLFFDSVEAFKNADLKFESELILIKGARSFSLESIVSSLQEKRHGTILEVNLENLVHNLNFYRSKCTQSTKVMVMVKAFAYGGGIHEIAHQLQFQKIDYLGVAYVDEGVALRKAGIHLPIMVMNPDPESFKVMKDFHLEPEIFSLEIARKYMSFAGRESIPIHLKINTGMNRLGVSIKDLDKLIELFDSSVQINSVFSHLAAADNEEHIDFSHEQARKLDYAYEKFANSFECKPLKHILNSSGIIALPEYQHDMVRLGIGIYGFESSGKFQSELKPVSTLKTIISQIREVKKGETIGYNRKGSAENDMTLAVVNIGYADGYARAFSNGVGKMNVGGVLAPVIGNVCMDMTMLDVTNIGAEVGDEVVVFGENPSISDLAVDIGTIPYEILTSISERVKREFTAG